MVKAKSVFAICFISVVFLALLLLVFYPRFSTVCDGITYQAAKVYTAKSDNPEDAFKELFEGELFKDANCKLVGISPARRSKWFINMYKRHGFTLWNASVECEYTAFTFTGAKKGSSLYTLEIGMGGSCYKENFDVYDELDNESKSSVFGALEYT